MIDSRLDILTLFRSVGQNELDLIQQSNYLRFPPRLPDQPIFYQVLTKEYGIQIARDWNAKYNESKCGYLTRFRVRKSFVDPYEPETIGGARSIRSTG